jgi:hypothetical protein
MAYDVFDAHFIYGVSMPQIKIDVPQGEPAEQLDRVLQIRFTDEQYNQIRQLAESSNMYVSTMARNLLMQLVNQLLEADGTSEKEALQSDGYETQ